MRLDDAVEILTSDRSSSYLFEREFAIAAFSGWLNSPDDAQGSTTTVFAALNRAIIWSAAQNVTPPIEWLTKVFNAPSYTTLLETAIATPLFWYTSDHLRYNNCNYAADIVRFLLTYKSKSLDRRKGASLGKAWEFINKHGGFNKGNFDNRRNDWCSISHHQVLWRRYKQSAPFQCARFHSPKFDWYFNPRQSNFLEQLIAAARRQKEIITFFRTALDYQLRLKVMLDERSMSAAAFFAFPAPLTPMTGRLPAISAAAYGKMAAYRRSTNLSEPVWD